MIAQSITCRLGAALTAVAVSACAIVDTGPTRSPHANLVDSRCDSMLGSYALSKTMLRVEVKGTDVDPAKARTALTALEEISVGDPSRIYCLDHLSSPTAKDEINVVRGVQAVTATGARAARTSTNLLTFVSSNSIDYTADIIRKIIRTIFIAVSGKPDFAPVARSLQANDAPTVTLADYTFDPFNMSDVVRTNEALRPLGFCILLEVHNSDRLAQEGARFCGDSGYLRRRRARFEEVYAEYERAVDLPARVPGILYRPREPFRVFIYAKDNPQGPDPWRLVQTAHMKLENISPVISLGVERAIFAARRTALLFDRGTLVGWCVSKSSELLAAMDIPLEVVRSIVALPTAIIQVRIDEVTRSNDLVAAERDLISLQRQYLAFLLNGNATSSPLPDKKKVALKADQTKAPAALTDFDFAADTKRQAPSFDDFSQVCTPPKATLNHIPGSKT